jgi:hypothetical protein
MRAATGSLGHSARRTRQVGDFARTAANYNNRSTPHETAIVHRYTAEPRMCGSGDRAALARSSVPADPVPMSDLNLTPVQVECSNPRPSG